MSKWVVLTACALAVTFLGWEHFGRLEWRAVVTASDFAGNLVGSVVPAAVRAVARGVDPAIRETEPTGDYGEGVTGAAGRTAAAAGNRIRAGIPFASQGLPAKRDQFGREKERMGGVFSQLFDVTRARRDVRNDDPLIAELSRVGATIGQLQRLPGEPTQDYLARQEQVGAVIYEALAKKMFDPRYRSLAPVEQKEALDRVVRFERARMARNRGRGQ